jgi:coiled-coil and C2 domain-containing protein 2A
LRPESLQTCKDCVYLNVFDEVEVDVLEDERERQHMVHKKKLRYWLGTLKIPFSTIYFKSKIEGTFKIETPNVMLGYTRDPKLSHIQTYMNMDTNSVMDTPIKGSSYLSLYITIEPQLIIPDAYRETVIFDNISLFMIEEFKSSKKCLNLFSTIQLRVKIYWMTLWPGRPV